MTFILDWVFRPLFLLGVFYLYNFIVLKIYYTVYKKSDTSIFEERDIYYSMKKSAPYYILGVLFYYLILSKE